VAARVRADVNAMDGLRLHIGGEQQKEGWRILNVQPGPGVDIVGDCSDLSRFADESVDEIYASHVLEHLGYVGKLPAALAEFHRVLKLGGVVRISVPDFEALCRLFLDPRCSKANRFRIMQMAFGGQIDPYEHGRLQGRLRANA
jgi:predicted SAM-dependent methyltransferase